MPKTIHSLGNGQTVLYGQGVDIVQAFSPCDAPSVFSLKWENPFPFRTVWDENTHQFRHVRISDGQVFITDRLSETDGLPETDNTFQRTVLSGKELIFRVNLNPCVRDTLNGQTLTLTVPKGAQVFFTVFTAGEQTTSLTVRNGIIGKTGDHTYTIRIQNGEILYHGTGKTPVRPPEEMLTVTPDDTINRMIAYTAHLISSQTAGCGGVIACYSGHLGYVRDTCFGVVGGLLAMGQTRAVRRILDYFTDIFRQTGCIHNAHPLGSATGHHEHENDRVEIPGYILLSLYEYFRKTGDTAFLADHLDVIDWAIRTQESQLSDGMLPFNGDETYIAGGILPRTVLDHGSFEATLLYIHCTERLTDALFTHRIITEEQRQSYLSAVIPAKNGFTAHFVDQDGIFVNNPARLNAHPARPETRRGVCVYCGRYVTDLHPIGTMYACPACAASATDIHDTTRYRIPSVALMAVYLGSDLIPEEQLKAMICPSIDAFAAGTNTGRFVGYEGGLLLHAAVRFRYKARETAGRLIGMADEFGGFAEYYEGNEVTGTMCRPWESAVNIEALIRYATDPAGF